MSRHIVALGDRLVHYRRFGEGPAVLVLHGSPQSSRAVIGVAQTLAAQGLCAIVPDTPGNGLSTPLPGAPSVVDYAAALNALADRLGLGRVALYGFHTGAAIACAFAARYPARVSAAVFNGLSCWTETERADLLDRYLPPFVPAWDGSHMAWAWARVEEHTVFFPWHQPVPANRMVYDVPAVAATHLNALDLLDSGDGYRAPYAAAFRFRTEAFLGEVACPMRIAATELDPLRPHLGRPGFGAARGTIYPDAAALAAAASWHLTTHPGDKAPPPPPPGADSAGLGRGWSDGLAWTGSLEGPGRPLVLLHGAGGARRIFDPVLRQLVGRRPVLALDLPGHGESDPEAPDGTGHDASQADRIEAACRALGLSTPALAGVAEGGRLAAILALRGGAVAACALGSAPDEDSPVTELAPSLAPVWDGGHLLRAFRIARWRRLFDPWFRRDRAHARPQGDLDPADIQASALDLVKAGDAWAGCITEVRAIRAPAPAGIDAGQDPSAWADLLSGFAA